MKKKILGCLLFIVIAGCNTESSVNLKDKNEFEEVTDEEKVANLETSGKLPVLDRSDDLLGPDEDNDGVRDDINTYINNLHLNSEQHAAAMQNAKALQKYMTVDVTDDIELRKLFKESNRSISCVFDRFDEPSVILGKLRSITTNTKQRLLASLAVSKAADGMAFRFETGNVCE